MNLDDLKNAVTVCTKCSLCKTRKNAVFGSGSLVAKLMIIGEAPGKNEDEKNIPFTGASGKILDLLLESINLSRNDVFITNIVKCRPPKNRDPKNIEIKKCTPYLKAQIKAINPKIIITLGRHSTKIITGLNETITELQGKPINIKDKNGIDRIVIPMFHPAVALYNRKKLGEMKTAFQKLKQITNET